ncbi:hypothetical protein RIF29_38916 [Crotalaria pallida]|uniref:Uncharacterized protein n=1 Tax=Crotalaria pallida TaxID=3830 RepID=A0AAN9HSU1_CROPI
MAVSYMCLPYKAYTRIPLLPLFSFSNYVNPLPSRFSRFPTLFSPSSPLIFNPHTLAQLKIDVTTNQHCSCFQQHPLANVAKCSPDTVLTTPKMQQQPTSFTFAPPCFLRERNWAT